MTVTNALQRNTPAAATNHVSALHSPHSPGNLRYGGLATDHPLLQKLIQQHEPDFPSIQRDLSRAINCLERNSSDKQVLAALMLARHGAPYLRFFGNLGNAVRNIQLTLSGQNHITPSHEQMILSCAKHFRSMFHDALSAQPSEKHSEITPATGYSGLATDHPALRGIISAKAPNNSHLQKALSLGVTGIEQNHTQQRILRDLNVLRSSTATRSGPHHPITSSQQAWEKSQSPKIVSTAVTINPLPDANELLDVAKTIHNAFHLQLRLQQSAEFADQRHERNRSHQPSSLTNEKSAVPELNNEEQPLERQREVYRSLTYGR
jgi:hypothetical protein